MKDVQLNEEIFHIPSPPVQRKLVKDDNKSEKSREEETHQSIGEFRRACGVRGRQDSESEGPLYSNDVIITSLRRRLI